jgi:rhamnogalacturonan endolyase
MHDHTYRMGICWQNTAYNQPPHLGYYLPDYIDGKLPTAIKAIDSSTDEAPEEILDLGGRKLPALQKGLNIVRKNGKTYKVLK